MPEDRPRKPWAARPRYLNAEDVRSYRPGGYHPVDIGDIISSGEHEYKVVHKLGHGGFSTVWLMLSCERPSQYFALKILRADVADAADSELKILKHLETVASAGHPNVVSLHDSFDVSGPNGEHRCLLFPFLGPSLAKISILAVRGNVESKIAAKTQVCRQVASATAFLHHHGVCHADLTAHNIVFELPNIQSITPDSVLQLLGPLRTEIGRSEKNRYSLHVPKHLVGNTDFSGVDFSLLTRVRIIDFGTAFFTNDPPKSLGVPIDSFPPEVCFGYLPSTRSDVWQIACLLYQIQTGRRLFPTGVPVFEVLIGTIVDRLGPLPENWREKFKSNEYGYMSDGEVMFEEKNVWYWYEDSKSKETFDDRLAAGAPHLTPHQRKDFADLLLKMVAYEPEKRLPAAEVSLRLEGGLQSGGSVRQVGSLMPLSPQNINV